MNTLSDGGGIYFLGHQRNTVISHNYINKVNRRNASLYSDNGSVYLYFTKMYVQIQSVLLQLLLAHIQIILLIIIPILILFMKNMMGNPKSFL